MPKVHTDPVTIARQLDQLIAGDAVRGTVLGTIRLTLEDTAWAAVGETGLAVRSSERYPVQLTGSWSPAQLADLADLLGRLPNLRGLAGHAELVTQVANALGHRGTVERISQRLFRLDELVPPVGVSGDAITAGESHRELVRDWYAAFMAEAHDIAQDPRAAADRGLAEGTCWLWRDDAGEVVSMAVRRRVLAGSARIGPVYTPPGERGRGYGSAVTAAATRDILDEGAVPVLFTDLANPTSNKIYQLLGYRPVEDRLMILFD